LQSTENAVHIGTSLVARPPTDEEISRRICGRIRIGQNPKCRPGLRDAALSDDVVRLLLQEMLPLEEIFIPVGVEPDAALLMKHPCVMLAPIANSAGAGKIASHRTLLLRLRNDDGHKPGGHEFL